MSITTCQEWHVKSDSREISRNELQVKGQKCQVRSDMSGVTSQELQVKRSKSRKRNQSDK